MNVESSSLKSLTFIPRVSSTLQNVPPFVLAGRLGGVPKEKSEVHLYL